MISLAMSLVGTSFVFFVRWAWPVHPDDTFAILLTGGLAAMVGAIAVVAAIWGTISARKIARSQTTFEHLAALKTDSSYQTSRACFSRIVRSGEGIERYAAREHEGSAELQAIISVLNEYELMSIGIQRGIVEPELYKRWAHSSVIFDWRSAQPFVLALRKRAGAQSLYHEFEEMARWVGQDHLPHRRFWWAGL
jgi:hypothetical protein